MELHALYHDVDRLPYLLLIRDHARKHGLTLHFEEHRRNGNEDWAEVLRREETDLIAESYWRLQRYHAAGTPFVAVASAVHDWTELLLVRPGIGSAADLRGKRVAVRGTGPQVVFPRVLFRELGWDVDLITFSEKETGRWGHWRRVVDGDCDGCFMLPLYADDALAAGLHPVAYPAFPFDGAHVTVTTTDRVLADKRPAFALLVRAMFDAAEDVRKHPAALDADVLEAREALSEHFDVSSGARLSRLSALLREEVWETPVPTPRGIENARVLAREHYPELDDYNPLLMWDTSLAREALT